MEKNLGYAVHCNAPLTVEELPTYLIKFGMVELVSTLIPVVRIEILFLAFSLSFGNMHKQSCNWNIKYSFRHLVTIC